MQRFLILLSLFAVAVSAVAQSDSITFEGRAAPITRLLDDLAEKSGWKVRAAPVMGTEVVAIRVKDVSRADLMAKLSKVTGGQWSREGETDVLVPDAGTRVREKAEAKAARRANIVKMIQTRIKQAKQMEEFERGGGDGGGGGTHASLGDQFGMGMYQGYFQSGSKAVTAFLSTANVDLLAGIEAGQRVVFSTAPNQMQRPLPGAVWPLLGAMVKEHNDQVEAQKRAKEEVTTTDEWEAKWRESLKAMGVDPDEETPVHITAAPAKALVIVSHGGGSGFSYMGAGGLQIELVIYDANGKKLTGHSDHLYDIDLDSEVSDEEYDPETGEIIKKPEPPEDPNDPKIALSDSSKTYMRSLSRYYEMSDDGEPIPRDDKPIPTDELAAHKRPDLIDPLSYGQTDALFFIAEKRGLQLVANLPDRMFLAEGRNLRISQYLENLTSQDMSAEIAGGWLIVTSKQADTDRMDRFNRASFVRLLQQAETKKVASLDDMATFAAANSDGGLNGMGDQFLQAFVPGAMSITMLRGMDWAILKFYGSLSGTNKAQLRQNGQIPLAALGGTSRTLLNQMLFGNSHRLEVDDPVKAPKDPLNPITEMILAAMQGQRSGKDYRTEPTEIMPTGLVAGVLELKAEDELLAVPSKWNSDIGLGAFGAMEIALFTHFMSDPKMAEFAGEMPEMPEMMPGARKAMKFAFRVAPDVVSRFELNDDTIEANGKPFKITNLPPAYAAAVEKYRDALKKTPFPFFDPDFLGGSKSFPPPGPQSPK